MKILTLETKTGQPYAAGETRITPVSRLLRLQIPGVPGGLIWNRPVAVRVQPPNGPEEVLPVRDVTRLAQILIIGLGFLGGLFAITALKTARKMVR